MLEEKKPEKIWDKIIEGKLKKYFEEVCLMDQKFIKNTDITVGTLVNNMIAKTGENIIVRRFARFQLGEEREVTFMDRPAIQAGAAQIERRGPDGKALLRH